VKLPHAETLVFSDRAALVQHAAALARAAGRRALAERGRFAVATCGADTTERVFEALAASDLSWRDVHVFASCSCATPDSRAWLARLPAPPRNVHAVPPGVTEPTVAASVYEQQVRAFFGVSGGELPRFDLIMLQLGADGHAASLFPGSSSLYETARLAVAEYVRQLGRHCVTFTAPLVNQARSVLLLASGTEVARALGETVAGAFEPQRLPAQLIRPVDGTLHVLADQAAAAALRSSRSIT
jgi:6-phosphogluconolactonase